MIQEIETDTDGQLTVCLRKTDDVESVAARMPTPAECAQHGFVSGSPVLVIRGADGYEQLFAASRTTVIFGD